MKIAFIHYHLKTGGVTRVLQQQVNALEKVCDILVLTGEPPESPIPAETVYVPGLGYSNEGMTPPPPQEVAGSILRAIRQKWPAGCDILHVHNPLLRKNRDFLKILNLLQTEKKNLFLQIHDFAEDGRPLSYYREEYPADCHYGVINSRDYEILLRSGLKERGVHKIFNMVHHLNAPETLIPGNRVLYPIRAIRRKNIGEAILLSLFFKGQETLSITLPPNSSSDMQSYAEWKQYVKEQGLRVEFESGLKHPFEKLISESRYILTTSITEGFGFQFLEPWTAGKWLCGRKLPGICDDFEKNGIQLNHLYAHLFVPVDWIGEHHLYEKWKTTVLDTCAQFKHTIQSHMIDSAFAEMTQRNRIDFGILDEVLQKQVVSRVVSGKKNVTQLLTLNPFLKYFGEESHNSLLIQENKQKVLDRYNETQYRKTLLSIYHKIISQPVIHRIDKKTLLSQFLDLARFSLLKWGIYPNSQDSV